MGESTDAFQMPHSEQEYYIREELASPKHLMSGNSLCLLQMFLRMEALNFSL